MWLSTLLVIGSLVRRDKSSGDWGGHARTSAWLDGCGGQGIYRGRSRPPPPQKGPLWGRAGSKASTGWPSGLLTG